MARGVLQPRRTRLRPSWLESSRRRGWRAYYVNSDHFRQAMWNAEGTGVHPKIISQTIDGMCRSLAGIGWVTGEAHLMPTAIFVTQPITWRLEVKYRSRTCWGSNQCASLSDQ